MVLFHLPLYTCVQCSAQLLSVNMMSSGVIFIMGNKRPPFLLCIYSTLTFSFFCKNKPVELKDNFIISVFLKKSLSGKPNILAVA